MESLAISSGLVALLVGTATLSALLTHVVRKLAICGGLVDVPNARSSHVRSTPRGGGIAIVVTSLAGFWALVAMHSLELSSAAALSLGGLLVAGVGLLDDRAPVKPVVRLAVHVCAAVLGLIILGGMPDFVVGDVRISFGWFGYVLGTVGIVWCVNLFNFMDGIDGLAGSEAVFVLGAGGLLAGLFGGADTVMAASLVLAAGVLGFLVWNWPPARIFLGDVGSGYLGYCIGLLAVMSAWTSPTGWYLWSILGALFFADATTTLLQRARRGVRLSEAHRTHAYQRLARRWGTHRAVTLASIATNVTWLLPLAVACAMRPDHAAWLAAVAVTSLMIVAWIAGAGTADQ
jgi:Fuc2NAc and GlcNAc transferase